MTILLDEATEQLVERELARGRFADANSLIAHALQLVSAEDSQAVGNEMNGWLQANRERVRAALDESCASRDRGEGYSADEVREHFTERRAA